MKNILSLHTKGAGDAKWPLDVLLLNPFDRFSSVPQYCFADAADDDVDDGKFYILNYEFRRAKKSIYRMQLVIDSF